MQLCGARTGGGSLTTSLSQRLSSTQGEFGSHVQSVCDGLLELGQRVKHYVVGLWKKKRAEAGRDKEAT